MTAMRRMLRIGSHVLVLALVWPLQAVAAQIDITTFNTLRRGMSESEILLRAGPPDLVEGIGLRSADRGVALVRGGTGHGEVIGFRKNRTEHTIKQLHYIPGPDEHDPQLTVITITGGLVSHLERTKMFGRSAYDAHRDDAPAEREVYSDEELKVRRADRTLKAAEHYARTRTRLKEQARLDEKSDEGANGARVIYRVTQPDGTVYYGDRPPGGSEYLTN